MLPFQELPQRQCGEGVQWLRGVRVVDLTTSIAGPFAAMLLADMGAEVTKVERTGRGDDTRHWRPPELDGESLWFLSVNRNKQSIGLDFTTEPGRAVLEKLITKADVVLLNNVLRTQEKLRIDYDTLSEINPKLIYVSITGFGLTGERADWTCYDLIAEGYSGIMDLTGEADGDPQKIGAPAADMIAASDAAIATLGAIFDTARTGKGHKVDVSLVSSMTRFLAPRIMSYLGSGEVPRRSSGRDSVIAVYQAFDTADFPLTLGLGNDNIWKRFWQTVGQPELGEQEHTSTNAKRREARAAIVSRIQDILIEKPREYWLTQFRNAGIPAGPINRLDEVVADDHLLERGLFYSVRDGKTAVPQVGSAYHLDGSSETLRTPPPRLGQHTREILVELGYSAEDIEILRGEGAIE